jgi:hypothetical protein
MPSAGTPAARRIVRDAATVAEGESVRVTLHRGEITAKVMKRT